MLYATNRFRGDGVTTQYEINFVGGYISRAHVKAYGENPLTLERWPITITPSMFLNATTIRGLPPMSTEHYLVIYRDTPRTSLVNFVNTSRFSEYNLDVVAQQGVMIAAEAMDLVNSDLMKQIVGDAAAAKAAVVAANAAVLAASGYAAQSLASAEGAEDTRNEVLALKEATITDVLALKELTRWHMEGAALSAYEAAVDANSALGAYSQAYNARISAEQAAVDAANARDATLTRISEATLAAELAATAADVALNAKDDAVTASQDSSVNSASAAVYAAEAAAIRDALAGGSLGFPAVAYDWGSVTDPSTYFNRDFGSLV